MSTFRPVKAAIIGSGVISGQYLETMRRLRILDIVGCSDLIPERSAGRAEEFGIRRMTNAEILSDPDVELVLNLTYPTAHYEVAKQALEAGKHVYTEKMIAISLAEARDLKRLADQKGLWCCGAPDTFLGGGFQTAQRVLDAGLIGQPVSATAILTRCYRQERAYTGDEKRFTLCKGGGILFDMGSYYLTFLVALLGGIHSVCGFTQIRRPERAFLHPDSALYGQAFEVESNNNAVGAILFENGALASLALSSETAAFHNSIIIHGTDGKLDLGDPNQFGVAPRLTTKFGEEVALPLTHAYDEGELRGLGPAEMAYSIRAGRTPRCEMQMPLHVAEAALGLASCPESGRIYRMTTPFSRPAALPMGYKENPELSLSL